MLFQSLILITLIGNVSFNMLKIAASIILSQLVSFRTNMMLDVKTFPSSVKGSDIYEDIIKMDPEILRKILIFVADTTAVNTGCRKGAFTLIKAYFMREYNIEIHTIECLNHIVELLFRHFFLYVEGPAISTDKLSKDAVYNLIDKINGKVELSSSNFSTFCRIECPDEVRKFITSLLQRFNEDKHKLRNDQACLLAYTSLVMGLDLPAGLKKILNYKQEIHGRARWLTTGSGYI